MAVPDRPLPPSSSDPAAVRAESPHLVRLRGLARVLDDLVRIPGTRFRVGIDPLLGVLPGAGDAATGAVAAYAILVAQRLGAPPSVLARMALNVLIDALVGAVPFLGDLFDFGWKASRKNVKLVEAYAQRPERVERSSRGLAIALVAGLVVALVLTIGLAVVVAAALVNVVRGWL